jgi:hypothetical protein
MCCYQGNITSGSTEGGVGRMRIRQVVVVGRDGGRDGGLGGDVGGGRGKDHLL